MLAGAIATPWIGPLRVLDRIAEGGMGDVFRALDTAREQILGEAVDRRADVYSLGCVLYELATGLRPFDGGSTHEIAQKHLHAEPPPPSEAVADLPWQLDALILEMLAKRPAARPPTAGAASQRLVTVLRHRQIAA